MPAWPRELLLKICRTPGSAPFAAPLKICSKASEPLTCPGKHRSKRRAVPGRPMRDLRPCFNNAKGHGVLATSDDQGRVNLAIFSRPHVFADQTLAFIMPHGLTHSSLQFKPHAAYLFMEDGPGYKGKRLYLTKIREEQDTELQRSLRRRTYPPGKEKPGPRFLVFFQVDKILPLIGAGEGSALP